MKENKMKVRIPNQGKPNMNNMLAQAQKMQEELAKVQEECENNEYSASVGGGMVEAAVSGKHQVLSLNIKPEVVDPEDIEMLSDLIVGAVNEALRKADEDMDGKMAKVNNPIAGLNIPGMI
jgi:DNA-binding YbaB/EbfC family protein